MTDRDLTTLFARADVEPEPALRPGFAEQTVTIARRSAHRRRTVGALAAAVLVAGTVAVSVVVAVGPAPGGQRPAARTGQPSLPDRFAGYSGRTAMATEQPPGRAVAMYTYGNHEVFRTYQPLVVGADRDTYRRVDAIEERGTDAGGYPEALLSPDGTQVLVGDERGNATSLVLVDLAGGPRRELPVDPPAGIRLLAWSPDGRYVAYGGAPVSAQFQPGGNAVTAETLARSELVILDLATGTSTHHPQLTPVRSASFAPDGRRLALQLDREAWIVTVDGRRERRLALPEGRELLTRHAWRPDGAVIATVPRSDDPPDQRWSNELAFVDATGDGRAVPPPVTVGWMLGWRSPTRLVTFAMGADAVGGSIVEVTVDTGERRELSRFSDSSSCEHGTAQCQVSDLQLATGLLATLGTRPGTDRGDRPLWHRLAFVGLAFVGLVVALIALVGWTARVIRPRR